MAAIACTLKNGRRLFARQPVSSTGGAADAAPGTASNAAPVDAAGPADVPTVAGAFTPSSCDAPAMHFTYPSGSTPLDRFTIRRGIGVGGFGEVYFAVSEAGKEVALKRVQRHLDVELRGVSHCLNLKHPNLLSLYDVCRDGEGQTWVVMEYVAGSNLRDTLDRAPGGLPENEVRRWLGGVAAGLAHLHDCGLVHRDLKPGNIFDDAGIVKIGDYGLSKIISCSRRGGHTESVGTVHYMAPEVGRGQYGHEIDIYALGVMLCEMLTGRVPFDGESSHEIVMKHLTALPDLTGVPQPYRHVIARSLEKDPRRRPQTVAEMVRPLGITLDATGVAHIERTAARAADRQAVDAVVVDSPADRGPSQPAAAGGGATYGGAALAACTARPAAPRGGCSEEPLARALRRSLGDLSQWWDSLERSPGTRLVLILIAAFVLVVNTHWLLPLLSLMAVIYVPYYVIRQMLLGIQRQPTYAEAHRMAAQRQQQPAPMSIRQWRQYKRTELAGKPPLARAAELSGAWTAAALTTAALVAAAGMFSLRDSELTATALAPFAMAAVTIACAAAALLALGKLWERDDSEGHGPARRLVLLGVGVGVGALAYLLAGFLMVPLHAGWGRDVDATSLPQALYGPDGPRAAAWMAHFALLLAGLRWWKNADPLRRRRLSLWAVAVAVVGEWVIQQFLPIPQPWGMMIAGGTAVVVQLAAPWENPRRAARSAAVGPTVTKMA